MRALAHPCQRIEEGFEGAGLAQAPEPFPHAVPMPEFLRKRAPGNVVNHEIMQGFEKAAVLPALVAAARARCRKHLQDNRPIRFRHGRKHGRSSKNRPPMSHRKTDLGIPPLATVLNPSTRPRGLDRSSRIGRRRSRTTYSINAQEGRTLVPSP